MDEKFTKSQLSAFKVAELKTIASEKFLNANGLRKDEIIQLILDNQEAEEIDELFEIEESDVQEVEEFDELVEIEESDVQENKPVENTEEKSSETNYPYILELDKPHMIYAKKDPMSEGLYSGTTVSVYSEQDEWLGVEAFVSGFGFVTGYMLKS